MLTLLPYRATTMNQATGRFGRTSGRGRCTTNHEEHRGHDWRLLRGLKPEAPAQFLRLEPRHVEAKPAALRRWPVTAGPASGENEGARPLAEFLDTLIQPCAGIQ